MSRPGIRIRPIDQADGDELDLVTRRCMATVLETIPELEGSAEVAHRVLGNFTFEQMRAMFARDFADPDKQILVAEEDGALLGHAIFSLKRDEQGRRYGFCFSRYVDPAARRRGVASALLAAQLGWWRQRGAEYAYAQTHVTNAPLQRLFEKHGFVRSGEKRGNWRYVELHRPLGAGRDR